MGKTLSVANRAKRERQVRYINVEPRTQYARHRPKKDRRGNNRIFWEVLRENRWAVGCLSIDNPPRGDERANCFSEDETPLDELRSDRVHPRRAVGVNDHTPYNSSKISKDLREKTFGAFDNYRVTVCLMSPGREVGGALQRRGKMVVSGGGGLATDERNNKKYWDKF